MSNKAESPTAIADEYLRFKEDDATFVNLTPHALNVHDENGSPLMLLEPSGDVARVEAVKVLNRISGGVPIYTSIYGDVVGLPERKPGVYYVVSRMVVQALQDSYPSEQRYDVVSPGDLLRDDLGRPIGCIGFSF